MNGFTAVLVSGLFGVYALGMLWLPVTRIIFFISVAAIVIGAIVFNERRAHQEYDDKLSSGRQRLAVEKWVEEVKDQRED